jgi:small subunit ribosomal protein S4e
MAASVALKIGRKAHRYLNKPDAGRHAAAGSMSILLLLRDYLKIVRQRREAKKVLSAGGVMVDGIARKHEGFPIGLMDIVSIPKMKAYYRISIIKGKLEPVVISEAEAKVKLCKVVGKKIIKGGKVQLAFHDGRTHVIEREEDQFSLGDTVKFEMPAQKMAGFLKLEKGARCYVHAGRHAGQIAVLQELLERPGSASTEVKLKAGGSEEIITRKSYLFVIDDSFKL